MSGDIVAELRAAQAALARVRAVAEDARHIAAQSPPTASTWEGGTTTDWQAATGVLKTLVSRFCAALDGDA